MSEIKILRMTLENFKSHGFLNLQFDGKNASIYGDNATGKTSVYDALTWMLFGKDSQGNGEKNIDIKPLDENGEVKDHQAITSVEVEFLADGESIVFKRTYREVWATRRGSSVPVYEGNISDYFVDGVPQKKNEYDRRIRELVSEELFRMLTSVSYFAASMKWQERRMTLFDMTGVMSDKDIMAQDARFEPLRESLGKLSIAEYKAKLLSQKKGLTGVRDDAPTRINECQKTIDDIRGLDFAGAKQEVEVLNFRKEKLAAQVLEIEHDNASESKRLEIRAEQLELSALERENQAYRASQNTGTADIAKLRYEFSTLTQRISRMEQALSHEREYIDSCDKSIARSREQWISVNGEIFTGGNCPSCGQTLPADKLQKAKDSFESRRAKRLAEIEDGANAYKEQKAQAEDRVKRYEADIAQMNNDASEIQQEIFKAENSRVEIVDMDGYQQKRDAINSRIQQLGNELADIVDSTSAVKSRLRAEIAEVQSEINKQMAIISKESLLEYSHNRMEQLREDAKNAAEALESIESMLFMMEEFTRFKAQFVEGSINDLFRLATFRLFREQANGGLEERCDVVYNGVPFMGLNNGMKVNVGIDIINALSRHYGVRVPLFVDNAEAVTRLENCDAQVIRLVVSENDKELRISYEDQR